MKLLIVFLVFASLTAVSLASTGYKPVLPRNWRRPPSRRFSEESEPIKFDHAKKSSLLPVHSVTSLSSQLHYQSSRDSLNVMRRSINNDHFHSAAASMKRPHPKIKKIIHLTE